MTKNSNRIHQDRFLLAYYVYSSVAVVSVGRGLRVEIAFFEIQVFRLSMRHLENVSFGFLDYKQLS